MSSPLSQRLDSDRTNLLCIAAVVVAIMLPVYFLGIPDGADLGQHIRFAARYHEGITHGDWFPGWSGSDNNGFGSAGIRVYPPLAYYVLAVTRILTGDWYAAVFADVLGWMLVGCIGIYLWVRERGDRRMALLAAVLYALVPYHLCQFYQMVLFAEFAAAGIIPFCFLFAHRLVSRGRPVDVVSLAAAYSLLLLTHIPTSMITSMALGLYVFLIVDKRRLFPVVWKFAAAFFAAISAASFYLVRLVTEVSWVQHDSPQYYLVGYYSYRQYLFPMVLVTTRNYAGKMLWHLDLQVALTILLFTAPVVALILHWKKQPESELVRGWLFPAVICGAFCLFMLSALSMPIWDRVTLLQKIQFPWRWLSLFSLFAAAAGAVGFFYVRDALPKFAKFAGYLLGGLVFVVLLFDLTQSIIQSSPLSREAFAEKIAKLDREEACPCWWPVWASDAAFLNKDQISVEGRTLVSSRTDRDSRSYTFNPGGTAATARLATFYYPHWRAYADGRPINSHPDESGALSVDLPAESVELDLRFEEPAKLIAARWVSLVAWSGIAGVLLLLIAGARRSRFKLPLID